MNTKIGYWLSLIFIYFSFSHSHAQAILRKANRYYNNYSYYKAIESYKTLLERKKKFTHKDSIYIQLADCYHKIRNFEQTEHWYNQVTDIDKMRPNHLYRYAETLINTGKYEQARPLLEKYHNLNEEDDRFEYKIHALESLNEYFVDSAQYKIHLMSINSPESDFSPTFYNEGFIFVSGRNNGVMTSRKFESDNSNFLDLYYTEVTETGIFKQPELFSAHINSMLHEGPSTFNRDEDFIFFTRNNVEHGKEGKSSDGVQKLMIYQAEKKFPGWGKVTPFEHSSPDYSTAHPTLTTDGKTLYFASNIDSGFGGADIYVSHLENEHWTKPKNIGHGVNTTGSELFPFIHPDGKSLYFASDGHGGIGGLDLYVAHWNDSTQEFGNVENLGYPLNTRYDDFGMTLDDSKRFGFLTSNRPGGVGSDDIYEFEIIDFGEIILKGTTFSFLEGHEEDSKEMIPNTTIFVYDSLTHEKIGQMSSTFEGLFEFTLERKKTYQLIADHPSLNQVHDTLYVNTDDLSIEKIENCDLLLEIPLGRKVHFVTPIVDVKTSKPLANAYIQIMNTQTKEIQTVLTDSSGNIDVMLEAETDYIIHGSKMGYFSNCMRITTPSPTPDLQSPSKALALKEIEEGTNIGLSSVYFDSNSDVIKPAAAKELDVIIKFLQRYKEVKIEISSHTDSRGSAIYNEKLSWRRSNNAVAYIIRNGGIEQSRVLSKGYGETQLVNRCKDRVPCSDVEHQANRRTELRILKVEKTTVDTEAFQKEQQLDTESDYSDCQYIPVTTKE